MTEQAFWQRKSLEEMSQAEWESLCDGCAKCCLHKLEDEDTGDIYYTKVVCRYLEQDSCSCSCYQEREVLVPSCVNVRKVDIADLPWMPSTCAYRLLYEGKDLPSWHPLVSGSPETVHRAGESVRGRALSEEYVHPDGLDEHIIHWVE